MRAATPNCSSTDDKVTYAAKAYDMGFLHFNAGVKCCASKDDRPEEYPPKSIVLAVPSGSEVMWCRGRPPEQELKSLALILFYILL